MAAEVSGKSDGTFVAGRPRALFDALRLTGDGTGGSGFHNFDVSRDGRRFLVVAAETPNNSENPIVVVLNWQTGVVK
jgi:hypothetical protein